MSRSHIATFGMLLAMTCANSTSMAAGENLVPNGNFDTDLTSWTPRYLGTRLWSPDDADGAQDSGSVEIDAAWSSRPTQLWSECIPVDGGRDYVFGAAQKHSPGPGSYAWGVGVALMWRQDAGCVVGLASVSIRSSNSDWTPTSRIVSAPADAASAYIVLSAWNLSILTTGEVDYGHITANFDNIVLAPLACAGSCGDVMPDAAEHAASDPTAGLVTSSDALYILKGAIGEETCPSCACDVDASGDINATDALLTLAAAAGAPVSLTCPQ